MQQATIRSLCRLRAQRPLAAMAVVSRALQLLPLASAAWVLRTHGWLLALLSALTMFTPFADAEPRQQLLGEG